MISIEDLSVEQVELLLRKVARGVLPNTGDVLMERNGKWFFTQIGFSVVGDGNFSWPDVLIAGGGTQFNTITASEVAVGDFILVSPPSSAASEIQATAQAGAGEFYLFLSNFNAGALQSLGNAPEQGSYLVLRKV